VLIRWEKAAVPFTVEVPNVEAVWRAKVAAAIAANPNDEAIPLQVANAYAGDDKWDEALKWADRSIKVKETFRNLAAKSQLLYLAGRKDEAFALADQAIAKGKADKVDTTNFEKRIAAWKAAKM
jgi:tetratricopeptide (TPR) repeat protein